MASLEFPDRSTQQTSNTTITASDIDIDATQGANINIITSSDHTKEDEEEEKKEDEKEKRRQKILNKLEKINEKISDTLDDIGGQTKEVVDDIVDKVFGNSLIVNKIKEGTYGIIKGVKTGTYKSISNLINFMKLEKKDRIFKLKGYVSKLKNIVISPFMMIWKVLKRVDKSITWIAEKLMVGLGKTLKYLIIGVAIFFKWIKKFLTKSMLWKVLSGVTSLIGGVFNITGDLFSGLWKILGVGTLLKKLGPIWDAISNIGSSLKQGAKYFLTKEFWSKLGTTILNFIKSKIFRVGIGVAGTLYAMFDPTEAGESEEDMARLGEQYPLKNQNVIASFDDKNNNSSKIISPETEYNQFIKEYPTVSRELLKKGWFDSDKDKNGLRDYNDEDYYRIDMLRKNPTNQMLLDDLRLSEAARQELKNKSILKNTAGVSST